MDYEIKLKKNLIQFFNEKGVDGNKCVKFLLSLRHEIEDTTIEEVYVWLSKNKYITRDFNTGKIVCLIGLYEGEEGIQLDNLLYDTIQNRIDEYRQLFKGIRVGSMGNKKQCIDDLVRFSSQYNKTFDEILDVTRWYIQNTQYPSNADNFIFHIDGNSGKEKSRLEVSFDEFMPEIENKFI